MRFRVRNCGSDQSCDTEQESCNTQDCTPEPTLRGEGREEREGGRGRGGRGRALNLNFCF